MTTKQQRLSFQFIQNEGAITFSACIPEEQVKNCGKVLWGLIGSGVVWAISHIPLHSMPSVNPPTMFPPAPTQVQNPQSTTGK